VPAQAWLISDVRSGVSTQTGTNVNPPPLEVRVEEVGLHNWQVDRDSAIQLQHGHLALLAPDRPKTALPVLHVSCRRTGPTIQP